jgi:hypothetical protein
MDAIQLNAVLLRNLLPDLKMTPGSMFVGRIMERHMGHGLLNLGGTVLVAKLPENVEAGARLRLAVQEVTPDTVVMRIVPDPAGAPAQQASQQAALPQTPAAVSVPLPDGSMAAMRLEVDADDSAAAGLLGEGPSTKAVTVHYDSPSLGRVDVRLVLGPNGLVAGVGAAAGVPVQLASEHADELRAGLSRAMGRPVDVHVGRRVEKARVDFRA